ncbi:MAG: serine/threonine-protein kinase [Polyangiaceae bacterium]
MDLDPGTVVANRYRISRQLGRGGMGEVFAAENIRTGRPVAVKLLRSDSKAKSSAVARFRREARAAGSINSDHVTQVLDVEEDSEHGICLVFELLEGESLIDRLKRTGPIPFDELHSIIEQVWIGLADAHKAGIIHRDLKPSNVFLERRPDGMVRVKILDFGISKLPKEMGGETLTEMGQSLGTFSFMPPEQIGKAKTVDQRADIYACGTLIYQALSGQLPYAARNILVMVEMKAKTDARKLADAMGNTIDPRLEAFLAHTLARDPMQRFQNATEALAVWRELRPASIQPVSSSGARSAGAGSTRPEQGDRRGVSSEPPAASSRAPKPQRPDMPISAMETTTDTAATLAMPISQLTGYPSQLRLEQYARAEPLRDPHGRAEQPRDAHLQEHQQDPRARQEAPRIGSGSYPAPVRPQLTTQMGTPLPPQAQQQPRGVVQQQQQQRQPQQQQGQQQQGQQQQGQQQQGQQQQGQQQQGQQQQGQQQRGQQQQGQQQQGQQQQGQQQQGQQQQGQQQQDQQQQGQQQDQQQQQQGQQQQQQQGQRQLSSLQRTLPLTSNLQQQYQVGMGGSDSRPATVPRDVGQRGHYGTTPMPNAVGAGGPMYRATPASGVQVANNLPRIYDDSTSQPRSSQDQTRVYQPHGQTPPSGTSPRPSEPGMRRDPELTGPGHSTMPIPLQRRRSAVPFVLGAIAFALVGFGIVAAVLQYLRIGSF